MDEFDPTDIEAQAEAKRQREQRSRLALSLEAEDVSWLMSSERGRRILWRLLSRAGVFQPSFSTNALVMAFAEGSRNAGLKLLAEITAAAPDQYIEMLKEANE